METVPQLHTPFFQDIFIHYLSPKYKLASQHRTALQATRGPGPLSETTFFQLVWALIDITLVCGWKSFSRCKNCTLSSSVYCQKYFKCRRDLSCLFCIIKACPHFTNIYFFLNTDLGGYSLSMILHLSSAITIVKFSQPPSGKVVTSHANCSAPLLWCTT